MFDLTQTFLISDENQQKVGFMSGFEWSRKSAISYPYFKQVWYGHPQIQNTVFKSLHLRIQKTRRFPQHRCLQAYRFVMDCLSTISFMIGIAKILICIFSNGEQESSSQLIFSTIPFVISVSLWILGRMGPIVQKIGKSRLQNKIKPSIQQCNESELRRLGVQARFPQVSKQFCLCIPCCDMCFKEVDFSRIDIFEVEAGNNFMGY